MIVLDTNVVSEVMKPDPAPSVLNWFNAKSNEGLWITAITAAELLRGVARLPGGHRKSALSASVADVFAIDFPGRILPFELDAAVEYAALTTARAVAGRPIGVADAMIAATALASRAALATRNIADFDGIRLPLVDPWGAWQG